jgi:hypothetical protein
MRTDELSKRIVKKHKLLTPPTEAGAEAGDDAEVSERQTELAHVAVPTQVGPKLVPRKGAAPSHFLQSVLHCTGEAATLSDPFSLSQHPQEPVIVAGRICSESLTESKINDQSIMLEVGAPFFFAMPDLKTQKKIAQLPLRPHRKGFA